MNWKQVFFQESLGYTQTVAAVSVFPLQLLILLAIIRSLINSYLLGTIQFVRKRRELCLQGTADGTAIALHGDAVHYHKAGKHRGVGRRSKPLPFMHMCGINFSL